MPESNGEKDNREKTARCNTQPEIREKTKLNDTLVVKTKSKMLIVWTCGMNKRQKVSKQHIVAG